MEEETFISFGDFIEWISSANVSEISHSDQMGALIQVRKSTAFTKTQTWYDITLQSDGKVHLKRGRK